MSGGLWTSQAPCLAPVSPCVGDTATPRDVRMLCTALPLPCAPWIPSTCTEGLHGLGENATSPPELVTEAWRQRGYGPRRVSRNRYDAPCASGTLRCDAPRPCAAVQPAHRRVVLGGSACAHVAATRMTSQRARSLERVPALERRSCVPWRSRIHRSTSTRCATACWWRAGGVPWLRHARSQVRMRSTRGRVCIRQHARGGPRPTPSRSAQRQQAVCASSVVPSVP